ncbi:beta-lactamase-like protein [Durotheca rogersii]|uniref:beta-lactamase-like protein n=1 Tax=Durotheca rogersii TaxID=419775 RepID=UPI00221EED40|nr:beta-lactamase-like protein [Durotheca rogersii]KAI5861690.1 beta-lactamase-like protein [Durotheca rogersii]
MATLPELNIPASTSTVDVSIVNTTGILRGLDPSRFFLPKIPGHDYLATPCFAFLLQHPALDRSLVFDLGMRKDYWNWPPHLLGFFEKANVDIIAPKGIREVLDEHGVDTKRIEAVIWSHSHFDHTGDPATFEPSTALIVGPGTKEKLFPGYPANPNARFLESDYAGREVRELDFAASTLRIGQFRAIDYFGDGSFYFLDSPGHCIGHVCGFARVTSSPDSFVLMGGDVIHHDGELRPHHWHPLPDAILPHPFAPLSTTPCPGSLFDALLRDGSREEPIYLPSLEPPPGQRAVHEDPALAAATIRRLQELDAYDNILVAAAHNHYLLQVADFFPAKANGFAAAGWTRKLRWKFLADFAKAVGYEGEVTATGDYTPLPKEGGA